MTEIPHTQLRHFGASVALVGGMVVGPLSVLAVLTLNYAIVASHCATAGKGRLFATIAGGVLATLGAAFATFRARHANHRVKFMVTCGLLLCGVSLLFFIAFSIPVSVLPSCAS